MDVLRFVIPRLMAPDAGDTSLLQFGVHDCMRLRQVLDEPGIDLAIDLWAGPGAYERLADAAAGWVGQ